MHPDTLPLPAAGKRQLPDLHGQRMIHLIGKACCRGPRLPVIDREGPAAMKVMRARAWAIRSIHAVQCFQKRRNINSDSRKIDALQMPCERFALKPAIDGPAERIAFSRLPQRQWCRDRKKQERCKRRQPPVLLFHLRNITGGTWHADQHVATKAKAAIVPAAQFHRPDLEISPLRKLVGDQRPDLLCGDDDAIIHAVLSVSGAKL
ncbi:hypothetical protein D3C86_1577860 [compost metagenome]